MYEKFLKNRTRKSEMQYKRYKTLFLSLKIKSKKKYYSERLSKYKNNVKKTGDTIKELIGKQSRYNPGLSFLHIQLYNSLQIADRFNKYFANVVPKLANKIQNNNITFDAYLDENETCMEATPVVIESEYTQIYRCMNTLKARKEYQSSDLDFIVKCAVQLSIVLTTCAGSQNRRDRTHAHMPKVSSGKFPHIIPKVSCDDVSFESTSSVHFL